MLRHPRTAGRRQGILRDDGEGRRGLRRQRFRRRPSQPGMPLRHPRGMPQDEVLHGRHERLFFGIGLPTGGHGNRRGREYVSGYEIVLSRVLQGRRVRGGRGRLRIFGRDQQRQRQRGDHGARRVCHEHRVQRTRVRVHEDERNEHGRGADRRNLRGGMVPSSSLHQRTDPQRRPVHRPRQRRSRMRSHVRPRHSPRQGRVRRARGMGMRSGRTMGRQPDAEGVRRREE
mmetsp:Transcript_13573/g.39581  ORF Transcript_13573/g.39581 Transcript_13573/m.39581 type:complete len:229 (-) Transcript_13573:107-793(-)